MSNLSFNKLKQIEKMRRIKSYKSMSQKKSLSALDESESPKSGNNFSNARIKNIREDVNKIRYRFLKPKIKEIRKNLYEIDWTNSYWIRRKSF